MLTLAIECATKSVGLALLDEGDVRAELYLGPGRHHAEVLLPALDGLFAMAGLTPECLDLLVCTVGPGSFTGVRIATGVIHGIALGGGILLCATEMLRRKDMDSVANLLK